MVIALCLLALAMVLGGAAAIYQGVLIFAFSSGATLVSAGVVAATGGVLLGGIAALLGALNRVETALAAIAAPPLPDGAEAGPVPREESAPPAPPVAVVPPAPETVPEPKPAPPPESRAEPKPAPPEGLRGTLPAAEPAKPGIAGTYSSGGNNYVMFSDGSIQADTPDGRFHFDTIEELKVFIAGGGERKR